jgi:hypothetical protein
MIPNSKKIIEFSDNLFFVESVDQTSNIQHYFIIFISNYSGLRKQFKLFNYEPDCSGTIVIDEKDFFVKSAEVIEFNYGISFNKANMFYDIIKSQLKFHSNLNEFLEELEEMFDKVEQPTKNEIQGLFAEFLFIKKYNCMGKYYHSHHLSTVDFEVPKQNIMFDVKSTTRKRNNIFTIHGNQMQQNVYFVNFQISYEGEKINIFELYNSIKDNLNENHFVHKYIQELETKTIVKDWVFSVDKSSFNVFQPLVEKEYIDIISDRIRNYSFEMDFSGLAKIEFETLKIS